MNIKSKFEPEDETNDIHRIQYIRGMCSTPLTMIEELTRKNVGSLRVPMYIQRVFRAMGWKTKTDMHPENGELGISILPQVLDDQSN
jgi:hypothetical protein